MKKLTRRKRIWAAGAMLAAAVIAVFFIFNKKGASFLDPLPREEVDAAYELIAGDLEEKKTYYVDFLRSTDAMSAESGVEAVSEEAGPVHLAHGEAARYTLNVAQAGLYHLFVDYLPDQDNLNEINLSLRINGQTLYQEMNSLGLKQVYYDVTKDFPTDSYGDQTASAVEQRHEWMTEGLHDNNWKTVAPLLFPLNKGENAIELTNIAQGCSFGVLKAAAPERLPTYSEYLTRYDLDDRAVTKEMIYVNAVDYTEKSARDVTVMNSSDVNAVPCSAEAQLLNAVAIQYSGNSITLRVDAPASGLYGMALRYESSVDDFPSFISLRVDGRVPYEELSVIELQPTHDQLKLAPLCDASGEPFLVFLAEGSHSIRIEVTRESMLSVSRELRLLLDHINQFALNVRKIAGQDIDTTRSWRFTRYMPDLEDYLRAYRVTLTDILVQIQNHVDSGINSSLLSPFQNAFITLDKMLEYPDDFPIYLDELSGSENSLAQTVGNLYAELTSELITIDGLYLCDAPEEFSSLPQKGTLDSLAYEFQRTLNTFTNPKYNTLAAEDEVLNVWVNRSTTEVDLIQRMTDTVFTPQTGEKVHFSVMPNVDKLIMAVAAERAPDVAMGGLSYVPYDLSSREALYDLTNFEDFWDFVDYAPPGSLVPFVFNEGVYAIPETIDINVLVYRTDIFLALGIEPQDTWEDMLDILPVLQRYGMNFYHLMAYGTGYKWFYQTMPILQQFNAELYSEDGLNTRMNQTEAIAGFKFLSDLFVQYSLPSQVPQFAVEFSSGKLPVGIADIGTYTLLKYGYPEIEGQWSVALSPGVTQPDGTISRWYTSNGTNACVFEKSQKKDEAWQFLKWWMSTDTQISYANTLSDCYGRGYVWVSANLEALSAANIPYNDLQIILEQAEWLRDVPRTPGQYMMERTISDIWNAIVFNGESAQVATDKRILAVQREIRKKMQEFGFIAADGNVLKPYRVCDIDWVKEQMSAYAGKE